MIGRLVILMGWLSRYYGYSSTVKDGITGRQIGTAAGIGPQLLGKYAQSIKNIV
jgi:hypothetical protein